jgi:hypothetical protein
MARKAISALLLLAVITWAEMALAPLLLLHAHAGMASSDHAEHPAASVPGHACCPKGITAVQPVTVPLLAVSSAGEPCAEQHRCCFRQGPQNPPVPVNDTGRPSRDLMAVDQASTATGSQPQRFTDFSTRFVLGSPPADLDMVFRS